MSHRRIILSAIAICLIHSMYGQVVEKLYTTDGAYYEGYISQQRPGNSISFVVSGAAVQPFHSSEGVMEKNVPISSLSDSQRLWFFENFPNETVVTKVSEDMIPNEYSNEYYIVGNPPRFTVKFCLSSAVSIPWNQIVRVNKNYSEITGNKDLIVYKDGKSDIGVITGNQIGKTLYFTDEKGEQKTVAYADVVSIKTIISESEYEGILANAAFYDRITLKSGKQLSGVIISRTLGRDISLLCNSDESVSTLSIMTKEIELYEKVPAQEKQYVPVLNDEIEENTGVDSNVEPRRLPSNSNSNRNVSASISINGENIPMGRAIADDGFNYYNPENVVKFKMGEPITVTFPSGAFSNDELFLTTTSISHSLGEIMFRFSNDGFSDCIKPQSVIKDDVITVVYEGLRSGVYVLGTPTDSVFYFFEITR